MGSLNIAEWSPDQVAEWMSGLEPSVARYASLLKERGLDGHRLLMLRCDDLEYLGMHIIGHQELLLEAVEHLRNFHYEMGRECVQQLAARVSVAATGVCRALTPASCPRLHTQALSDIAHIMHCVKPLVCWLDRWAMMCSAGAGVGARRAALLKVCLEAATCAQRDRFADQPARAVAAAAKAAAAAADYIVQEVSDPLILQPASLDTVTLRQGRRALGFEVVRSFCGHYQLADIKFGSPAHASGALHEGDEILQVSGACVIGWSGARVAAACSAAAGGGGGGGGGAGGDLALRLRRTLRPYPKLNRFLHHNNERKEVTYIKEEPAAESPAVGADGAQSDSSEPLSPPASPSHHSTRLYLPRPPHVLSRRCSVSGATPPPARRDTTIDQFWRELKEQRFTGDSADISTEPDNSLYRRDKAVSCSTGLEVPPRPVTSPPAPPGVVPHPPRPPPRPDPRGKLDKSHSTPAYDFDPTLPAPRPPPASPEPPAPAPAAPPDPPHSAEKADQILDFKKSSSQIGEAILQQQKRDKVEFSFEPVLEEVEKTDRVLETINIAMMERQKEQRTLKTQTSQSSEAKSFSAEHVRTIQEEIVQAINDQRVRRPSKPSEVPPAPPPRPPSTQKPVVRESGPVWELPVLRPVRPGPGTGTTPTSGRPTKLDGSQISLPLRHITKHDIKVIPSERREMPPINGDPDCSELRDPRKRDHTMDAALGASGTATPLASPTKALVSPTSSVVRGIFPTSKSRSLKKKNSMLARRRGVPAAEVVESGAWGGWALRRTRGAVGGAGGAVSWAARLLLLQHGALYAYRRAGSRRAECRLQLHGLTVAAAPEVKSRDHAFKVYHTGTAYYFATQADHELQAWLQLLTRAATMPPHHTQVDISAQFSETDCSDSESDEHERVKEKTKEKEKDRSKFNSLKKLTHRVYSQDNVSHNSTSLDRKYLRFFSRGKKEDKSKNKPGVPIPTEHYRSYRRPPPDVAPADPPTPTEDQDLVSKMPKPINYIHASNPNLLDFEKSDFVTKPNLQVPKTKVQKPENFLGFVTLEEFMLQKQEEERKQLYTNRVLMGIERDKKEAIGKKAAKDLQKRLERIVPDVIYGEVPLRRSPHDVTPNTSDNFSPNMSLNRSNKPISVTGKDGYEKIVYPDEKSSSDETVPSVSRRDKPWRDSLRRKDKVHKWELASSSKQPPPVADKPTISSTPGPGVSRLRLMFGGTSDAQRPLVQYPHLQCPPTFTPETYSLAALAPSPSPSPSPAPSPAAPLPPDK